MRCYYEVLGVERLATQDELRKAYRRKALLLHPDKNPDRVQEATQEFAEVQTAYEVLSDEQERAWYDSHRDAILRGDGHSGSGGGSGGGHGVNENVTSTEQLMSYFSAACYQSPIPPPAWVAGGRPDATAGESRNFYAVYRSLFERLEREEREAVQTDPDALHDFIVDEQDAGHFGDAATEYEPGVRHFYARFTNFSTVKSFRWFDEYRLADIPDRRVRRLAEKHNKKLRDNARKEFNEAVRNLAAFVKKRDPRVKAFVDESAKVRKEALERARTEAARAAKAERARLAETYKEAEWSKVRDRADMDEVIANADEDLYYDEYACVACGKSFRSERQLANHEQSRKHIETIRRLREELLAEGLDPDEELGLAGEGASDGEEVDGEEGAEQTADADEVDLDDAANGADPDENPGDGDGGDSDSDGRPARAGKQSRKQQRKQAKKQQQRRAADADNDASDAGVAEIQLGVDQVSLSPGDADADAAAPPLQGNSDEDEDVWNTKRGGKAKGGKKKGKTASQGQAQAQAPASGKPGRAKSGASATPSSTPAPAADAAADAGVDALGPGSGKQETALLVCNVCASAFSTRNKLFDHIKATGHALAAAPSVGGGGGGSGKKSKKR